MFFPFADHPNPRGYIPWVTWGLIAANVLIFLLISLPLSMTRVDPTDPALIEWLRAVSRVGVDPRLLAARATAYDLFTFAHGYKPGAPALDDLLFSLFLHAGFLHLAGNMLFLWIYGDNVEHRLGRLKFLLAYIGSGVAATLAFSTMAGHSMTPLVGASGAISGVLGMYYVWFPRNQVKVFVAFFPFLFDVVMVPARFVLAIFVIVDNLVPLLMGAGGGVAYGAHLGGFAAGLALAAVLARRGVPAELRRDPRVHDRERASGGTLDRRQARAASELATGRMWLERGYPVNAWQHLANAARLDPDGPIGAEARALMAEIS